MRNAITFACGKDDKLLEVQLEPEALIFRVPPGNEITFTGESDAGSVEWSMQFYQAENLVQLCPASKEFFDIAIYENGVLLDDWWKYM
ncbi:MAG: hypothetical protein EOO57_12425 [Hymenobacter sp.]|nr:MAG: hypothetical protein EOO57_12425 [Hymenobacter sp.]